MARLVMLHVKATVPDKAGHKEIRAYLISALASWCGSLHPPGWGTGGLDPDEQGDPMWDGIQVKVLSIINKSPKHPDKRYGKKKARRTERKWRNYGGNTD